MNEERKYRVKGSWIFNLESMQDKLWCIIYDTREGEIQFPVTICGKECKDESDIWELKDEASELEWIAKTRKVTSKEYGRIKKLVEWRVSVRYAVCMASGMSESDAGKCWEDM